MICAVSNLQVTELKKRKKKKNRNKRLDGDFRFDMYER